MRVSRLASKWRAPSCCSPNTTVPAGRPGQVRSGRLGVSWDVGGVDGPVEPSEAGPPDRGQVSSTGGLHGRVGRACAKAQNCPTGPGLNYPSFGFAERGTNPRWRAKRVRSARRRDPVLLRMRSRWEWTVRTLT
jgi:hypothetical protein